MYKGQLEGFPREIVERMLECQVEQGNPKDVAVFEVDRCTDQRCKGFTWKNTSEGHHFWARILMSGKLDTFFKKYPKTSYPKVMMVGNAYPLTRKRVVFMELRGKFLAWSDADSLEDSETVLDIVAWKYAEDIVPENPQKQELLNKAEELIQKAEELKAAANKL
jgi:hypothetical protein